MILGWTPQIGDPTIGAWLTVANYAGACLLAVCAGRADHRHPTFWRIAALLMLVLGINKQLDLQILLTGIGRAVADRYHWVAYRQLIRDWFVEIVAVAALLTTAILIVAGRRSGKAVLLATVGIGLSGCFVVARAALFNHLDRQLDLSFVALRLNLMLENAAIACVGAGAIAAILSARQARRPVAPVTPDSDPPPPSAR